MTGTGSDQITSAWLTEIVSQAENAIFGFNLMRQAVKNRDIRGTFYYAHCFLNSAACVSKILWPGRIKYDRRLTKAENEARQKRSDSRGAHLQQLVGVGV